VALAVFNSEHGARLWVEVGFWAVPAAGALARFLRGEHGRRLCWLLVCAGCLVITLDKAFDIQVPVHHLGQRLVHDLDPVHRMRGEHLWMRWLLLGGGFLVGTGGLVFVASRDRALDGGKRMSLLGLVLVLGYLGCRMLPQVAQRIEGRTELVIEGVCWILTAAGIVLGDRRTST
jgi:hypothetical protein